jgi:CheY-like chemotaxis protein
MPSPPAATARGRPQPAAAPILLVEDDPVISRLLADVFAFAGYAVVTAANGAEALERARRQPPRLIVLDLNMPVMGGRAFLATYREQPGPHAPVVLCTATHHRPEDLAAQLGAAECVAKPFDVDELLAAIQRHALPAPAAVRSAATR